MGAFLAHEMTRHKAAPGAKVPLLMVQVLKDASTGNREDAQRAFDLLGSREEEPFWVEGTTKRFKDRYNYFGPASRESACLLPGAYGLTMGVRFPDSAPVGQRIAVQYFRHMGPATDNLS